MSDSYFIEDPYLILILNFILITEKKNWFLSPFGFCSDLKLQ